MKKNLFALRINSDGEFVSTYLNKDKIPFACWHGETVTSEQLSDTLRAAASYVSDSLSPPYSFLENLTNKNANTLRKIIEKYHISAEDAQTIASYVGLQISKEVL